MPDSKFWGGQSASRLSVSTYRDPFLMAKGEWVVGRLALMEDLRRLLLIQNLPSRASSGSISSDSEESKDVRRSYAAYERYGCESFGRNNK